MKRKSERPGRPPRASRSSTPVPPPPRRVPASRQARRSGEEALTEAEVRALLANGFRDLADEALFRLAISTGIRREDIVAIRTEGLSREFFDARGEATSGTVTYYEAKKRRTRQVPVTGDTFLRTRQLVRINRRARWLFPSNHSGTGHISGRHAYDILQEALGRAKLRPRPFHSLRATCVKLAQRRGWLPEQVCELTGDTIRTIQEHYSAPSRDEMAEVAAARPIL